jgi:SOS-response transcriptional repressor LexA
MVKMEAAAMRGVEYCFLQVRLPGWRTAENAGVLLLDSETGALHLKLRRDWESFAGEEAEVLSLLEVDLRQKAEEMGGAAVLAYMEENLSHVVTVSEREKTMAADPEARLRRLYRENVNEQGVVPVYGRLRAAAGGLGEENRGELEGSLEIPPGVRAVPGMFAVRIQGRSMEPEIPDGSLCLFRPVPAGSRNGKKLLIQRWGVEETAQLTVKVYRSEKRVGEEGDWEHEKIRMIPLNPEFEEWELRPDEFGVVGEFVAVYPPEE